MDLSITISVCWPLDERLLRLSRQDYSGDRVRALATRSLTKKREISESRRREAILETDSVNLEGIRRTYRLPRHYYMVFGWFFSVSCGNSPNICR